jgi:predicted nucleotidyltransferase
MSEALPANPLPYIIDFSALYGKAEAISHAYRNGNLVFFLGAGASKAFDVKFPNWPELLNALQSELPTERPEDRPEIKNLIAAGKYLLAAEAIKRYAVVDRDSRDQVVDRKVGSILGRRPLAEGNPDLHQAILDFQSPVVTTNFDTILEATLRRHGLDGTVPVFTFEEDEPIGERLDPTGEQSQYVFKLHGGTGKGSLILDEGDYTDMYFRENRPRALALLRHILTTKMVVFVGFSLSDPEIMPILREATRYSSTYQHIAFMRESTISKIEREVLRAYYRVDPILYEEHGELPLFILEMRNFNPRDRLTLKLLAKKDMLLEAAGGIAKKENLPDDCSIIFFGSYTKYGDLTSGESDLDILLIDPMETESRKAEFTEDVQVLGRRVDVTIMSRVGFEELLRQGDAFASSILVTGCPIRDPKGIFTILARGFVPQYQAQEVTANALNRSRLRWLRMCTLVNTEDRKDFLRACLQWMISFMQFSLIQRKAPSSLLEASLLGNARFVIHEFVQRFDSADEEFFLDILRGSKGLATSRPEGWPAIKNVAATLLSALAGNAIEEETALLKSRNKLPGLELEKVKRLYFSVADALNLIYDEQLDSLPGKIEDDFLVLFSNSDLAPDLNPFDWLFFFQLFGTAGHLEKKEPDLSQAIETLRKDWAG